MIDNFDFKIIPIFKQSEELCETFADIDIRCSIDMGRDYIPLRDLDKDYFDMWKKEKNVFAFVAWDKKQIIGFANGYMDNDAMMYLNSLYVEPLYQHFGIGSKLLQTVENMACILVSNIKLFPLTKAVKFYQRYKYKYAGADNKYMVKKLPKTIMGVVPVFEWCDELQAKLSFKVDNAFLKSYEHQPMFVYIGKNNNIDGVAVRLPDGKNDIKLNEKQKSVLKYRKTELEYALNNCR